MAKRMAVSAETNATTSSISATKSKRRKALIGADYSLPFLGEAVRSSAAAAREDGNHAYTAGMTSATDLLTPLRRYWGFDSFRPLQERVVRSLMAGHDSCVVMPTGGGKSLCYQLPALVSEKTAVVISPLIALMQGQAAPLGQMGISSAVLNSSLAGAKQSLVMREAESGQDRLLYLFPERVARAGTHSWLEPGPVPVFAV